MRLKQSNNKNKMWQLSVQNETDRQTDRQTESVRALIVSSKLKVSSIRDFV